jgi:hypothetical protein
MAETISNPTSRGADYGEGTITGKSIAAAANQELITLTIPRGATRFYFEVKNSHASAVSFDEFTIQRRAHPSGNWSTTASIAGDYSSPESPLLEVDGAPVTLAQNASAFIRMDVEATDAVRILASGNAAVTTADFHYGVQ